MTLLSRKHIDEHDVVARYLADQLSDAEREGFETYYLDHPEILQELNTAAQFKSGLMDLQKFGTLEALLKHRSRLSRASGIAIAASMMIAVVGGAIWFGQANRRPIIAESVTALISPLQSTLPLADTFEIQRTRTSSYDATIELPTNSAAIELRVKPEVVAVPARYRIKLALIAANDSTTLISETKALLPSKDGFVSVYLNASKLVPAVYELTISGDADTSAAGNVSPFLIEAIARNPSPK